LTIKASRILFLALALDILPVWAPLSAQQQGRTKPIKVAFRVVTEGPEGLSFQAGTDLTLAEVNQLHSLIAAELGKLSNHRLVSTDEKDDIVGIAVVAEKVLCGQVTYILVSSALIMSKTDGADLFLTHDVIAEPSLKLAAHAVVGQLLAVELRTNLGLR
jgi:hypothetical protein